MNFCILIQPSAVAVLGTGVATINTASPTLHRRLANNVFTTKAELQKALQKYDADATDSIARFGPIAGWDVSAITNMSYLFYDLTNFNTDISSWNTSCATDMDFMFRSASAFNQPLSLGPFWQLVVPRGQVL